MGVPNNGFLHRERIAPAEAGRTVLAHLSLRHARATEQQWLDRITSGQVRLEKELTTGNAILQAGQCLTWARPPWVEPEVPMATAVLYEDQDLLAVAKPSGLPTLPGGGEFLEHTLLALVRQRHPEASPMHRLGRGTSGLVLFARTSLARQLVQVAFREHALRKHYVTLCSGHPALDLFSVTTPIGEVPHPLLKGLHAASASGRPSASDVRVLERREEATLVAVEIHTGRPHQIRIHLAAAGHPLVGDPLYGPGGLPLPDTHALPGDLGYLLHAERLEFPHPRTGATVRIHCQPPPLLRLQRQAKDKRVPGQ